MLHFFLFYPDFAFSVLCPDAHAEYCYPSAHIMNVAYALSRLDSITQNVHSTCFDFIQCLGLFQSRAALSLLAYCNYQVQDFVNAADCYEQLSNDYPDVEEYRLHYAQSLYKACLYDEAMRVCCQIDRPEYQHKVSCS